eukprot:TRINITY_DN1455_c0_g3_i1.p1 TRINITY_DN1455_c0_g3~~TRINITY_DN1455_c0_g3_i1.p1  ORF type:complete len:356 (-),score=72.38 TRINITY_DN1455_c0_g3_i1:399-1466(-)
MNAGRNIQPKDQVLLNESQKKEIVDLFPKYKQEYPHRCWVKLAEDFEKAYQQPITHNRLRTQVLSSIDSADARTAVALAETPRAARRRKSRGPQPRHRGLEGFATGQVPWDSLEGNQELASQLSPALDAWRVSGQFHHPPPWQQRRFGTQPMSDPAAAAWASVAHSLHAPAPRSAALADEPAELEEGELVDDEPRTGAGTTDNTDEPRTEAASATDAEPPASDIDIGLYDPYGWIEPTWESEDAPEGAAEREAASHLPFLGQQPAFGPRPGAFKAYSDLEEVAAAVADHLAQLFGDEAAAGIDLAFIKNEKIYGAAFDSLTDDLLSRLGIRQYGVRHAILSLRRQPKLPYCTDRA